MYNALIDDMRRKQTARAIYNYEQDYDDIESEKDEDNKDECCKSCMDGQGRYFKAMKQGMHRMLDDHKQGMHRMLDDHIVDEALKRCHKRFPHNAALRTGCKFDMEKEVRERLGSKPENYYRNRDMWHKYEPDTYN